MAQDRFPDPNYMKHALTAWISRTRRSKPRPLTQDEFIQEHRKSQMSEGVAHLHENLWPEYKSLASQTSLGSTGLSAFPDPQENIPDSALEPIEEDDDGSETSDAPSNPRHRDQGANKYCQNSVKGSPAQNETVFNIQHEGGNVIDTLTTGINMLGQVARKPRKRSGASATPSSN